eukprot:CAMPEP_0184644958 /NCGR_PEP_ID=MMETSP0308-20130426/1549_1 /TAXON_ID=38269 /ORGANISM="Gloeochaete witrockiana, Strain SAG 46.84" /LENGTH=251 /DNA_ID=CAMNT_0027073719 /DNA_START=165 /DNA_END=920 /DNA_ORIENTATION=+
MSAAAKIDRSDKIEDATPYRIDSPTQCKPIDSWTIPPPLLVETSSESDLLNDNTEVPSTPARPEPERIGLSLLMSTPDLPRSMKEYGFSSSFIAFRERFSKLEAEVKRIAPTALRLEGALSDVAALQRIAEENVEVQKALLEHVDFVEQRVSVLEAQNQCLARRISALETHEESGHNAPQRQGNSSDRRLHDYVYELSTYALRSPLLSIARLPLTFMHIGYISFTLLLGIAMDLSTAVTVGIWRGLVSKTG